MTPRQYAKSEILAGRFPMIIIDRFDDVSMFWLTDGDYKTLDNAAFPTRERAEMAKQKALSYARKFIRS